MRPWAHYLEKPWVIRLLGLALILSPFVNAYFQIRYLQDRGLLALYGASSISYFKTVGITHYILAFSNIIIGLLMLSGKKKVWFQVLILIAMHLFMQLLSYKTPIWHTIYPWLSLIANVLVFIFVADQIVFKIEPKEKIPSLTNATANINTNSFAVEKKSQSQDTFNSYHENEMQTDKQILLQEENADLPWGVVQSLTFDQLSIKKIEKNYHVNKFNFIELYLDTNLNLQCQFENENDQYAYYKVLKTKPEKLHQSQLLTWFNKIKTSSL